MPLELIIFDLDGTIIDSCEDIARALNFCLEKKGISGFSVEEVKQMVGEGVKRLIEKAIERKAVLISKEELIDCFVKYYREHVTDYTKEYPEVRETLQRLNNYKKAVISNKLTDLCVKALENLNLLQYFDFVGGSDLFTEKKPSALPILKTIEMFKSSPEKTLIVGDSELDIMAGKSAKVKTVAVSYGYRERDKLKEADFIIDKFSELITIVQGFQ